MRAKKGFTLRTVVGENIIVPEGKENIDVTNIVSMNESAALLWQSIVDKESFTAEDLAQILTDNYEVDEDTALTDATAIAAKWIETGIAEE
ncbi:MAG: PqqD family protein [Prevotella sp.]|nr:PqqD family protein [Prevotella sp.]